MNQVRYAIVPVTGAHADAEAIKAYLPSNYQVVGTVPNDIDGQSVIIAGTDRAGWTLDDYVIPRLASGLIWATELVTKESK